MATGVTPRSIPTRFPNGMTTAGRSTALAMYGAPDPTKWHAFWDDFDKYAAGDWTITATGAGSVALTDIDGGALLLTNAAADDDAQFLNKKGESFLLTAGKKAIFKARLKVSDATQSDLVIGLQVTDTTPLDVTDGIYFLKSDGSTSVAIICRKDATTGSTTATGIATVVADTYLTLGWYYDGVSSLTYFVDDVQKGTLVATSAFLPDTELTVSIGLQNGEAVAKTMSVDFIFAAIER